MNTIQSFSFDDKFTFDAPRGYSRTVDFRRVRSACGSDEAFSRWIMDMARHGIRQKCADKYSTTQGDADTKNAKTVELLAAFHNGGIGSGRSTDPVIVEVKALLRKAKYNSQTIKEIRTLNDVQKVLGDKADAFLSAAKKKVELDNEFLGLIRDPAHR